MHLIWMKVFIIKLGQFLFRYRAWIAVPFFILLVIFSRPDRIRIIPSIILLIGFFIRFWAAGYIGQRARATGFFTGHRIINGPYKYLKHPLYIGNFFLVLGIVLLFNPVLWFAVLILILFFFIYTLIIISESDYLKDLPETKAHFKFANCRGEISTVVIVIFILLILYLVPKSILT